MKCPKCNLPLIKESNVTTFSNQREEIAVIHEPETETLQTNHLSYEEMRKDYDRRNSRQKLISDALGKKMLSGWTMLGTEQTDFFVCMYDTHLISTRLCFVSLQEHRVRRKNAAEPH